MNPHADSVQQPSDAELDAAWEQWDWEGWTHSGNARRAFIRSILARFGTRPAAEPRSLTAAEHQVLREAVWDSAEIVHPGIAAEPSQSAGEAELLQEAQAEGFDSVAEYVANLKTSATTYFAERNSVRDAYRRHREESEARGKLINIVLGLVDAPAGANVVQAVAAALSRQAPAAPAEADPAGDNPWHDAPTQQDTKPAFWVLTEQLRKRETTHLGYMWFVDPQNSAWTPVYTAIPPSGEDNHA